MVTGSMLDPVATPVTGGGVSGYLHRAAGGIRLAPHGGAAARPRVMRPADRHGASFVTGFTMMVSARSRRIKVTGGCPIFFSLVPAPHEAVPG